MGATMRGRAFKIRQVFAELRHALGNEIPAIELLQLATKLVDATRAPSVGDDDKIVSLRPSMISFRWIRHSPTAAGGSWRAIALTTRTNLKMTRA